MSDKDFENDFQETKKAGQNISISDKLDRIETRLKRVEIKETIKLTFVLLGFIGIVSFAALKAKLFD